MLCQSLRNSSKSPTKSSIADSRIQKDLHELATQRWHANCSVRITFPSTPANTTTAATSTTGSGQHNSPHLHVLITPTDGAYKHSSFLFSIHLPHQYPFSPPHVRCLTPCLHPLLSFRTGRVYHPILSHDWKPVLSLNTVVFALQLLFHMHDSSGTAGQLAVLRESEGDAEVRRLMEQSGGGMFDVLVQQTLDGGFYFGMQWAKNRGQNAEEEAAEERSMGGEERKERSPRHQRLKRGGGGGGGRGGVDVSGPVDELDEDARKRPRKSDERWDEARQYEQQEDEREDENEEAREEENEEDEDDDRHRKHKLPHRHFIHRQTAISPPPRPLLHTVHRTRRAPRNERKEEAAAAAGGDVDEDARMTRADSFSFTALHSSLPRGGTSPVPLQHPSSAVAVGVVTTPSNYLASSSPNAPSRLFALSSYPLTASSPALGSLAAMQREHAMRTTLGSSRAQPVNVRPVSASDSGGGGGSGAGSVARTLSSVMAD